jgi:hypothetical protein
MTKRVTLIQCTDSKRDGAALARDLYDESRYFRKMRAWAIARDNPWFILSGKHGLVAPNQVLRPYNARGISPQQANSVADTLASIGVETVDVTAGADYTEHLIPELESRGIDVVNHFAGERIGDRQELLALATSELVNESLC